MNVLRHNDVSEDKKDISPADLFKGLLKEVAGRWIGEIGLTGVATEGEEVKVVGTLVTLELGRHVCLSPTPP